MDGHIEVDSHTNTVILGANCTIVSLTGQVCEDLPYSDTNDSIQNVTVITWATLWTQPDDGQDYILLFHQALWDG